MSHLTDNVTGEVSDADNESLKCGVWDDDMQASATMCSFWMEGVMIVVTGTKDSATAKKKPRFFQNWPECAYDPTFIAWLVIQQKY